MKQFIQILNKLGEPMKKILMVVAALAMFGVNVFCQEPIIFESLKAPLAAYYLATTGSTALTPWTKDPCALFQTTPKAVSQAAQGPTKIISGVAGRYIYLCELHFVTASTQNFTLIEGGGTNCGTAALALFGGVTAATGWNLAANGSIATGDGSSTIAHTAVTGNDVCIVSSSTGQISGNVVYIIK